jgi:homoserine dehydrogenase
VRGFEAAVKKAQDLGIAETDPSFDVDGWDATVKVSALATVLMDYPLRPNDIAREGIRGLSMEQVQSAMMMGRRYKLVCHAKRSASPTAAWQAASVLSRCRTTSPWGHATARRRSSCSRWT